ncbi:MAG TPA: hypothetical protein VN081_00350 [Dongiaceae bacterium]|nr:hypothetical protein [Dongiaceae bacterium]
MLVLHNGMVFLHKGDKLFADETTFVPYADWIAADRDMSALVWQNAPRSW